MNSLTRTVSNHLACAIRAPGLSQYLANYCQFFDFPGSLRRISKLLPLGLHGYLVNTERSPVGKPRDMPQEEVEMFLDFLSWALALDPDERWGAAQLLEHEWIAEG